jgi:hypothetical protein
MYIALLGGVVLFLALLAVGNWIVELLTALGDREERRTILSLFGVVVVVGAACVLILIFSPSYLNNTCHIPTPRF